MNFEDYVIKFFDAAKLKAQKIPESDKKNWTDPAPVDDPAV